jgi:hypothetical protein
MGLLAGLLLGSCLSLASLPADLPGTGFQLVDGDTLPLAPPLIWSEDAADLDDDEIGKCNAFSVGFQAAPMGGYAGTAGVTVRAEALVDTPQGACCSLFLACGRLIC